MKKYKVAIVFNQPPFGTSSSREGLDALLAFSAFCEEDEIAICFLNDGVFNLSPYQQPESILQKDHISMLKLIELYELTHCFICQQSFEKRRISTENRLLKSAKFVSQQEIFTIVNHSEKVLTF